MLSTNLFYHFQGLVIFYKVQAYKVTHLIFPLLEQKEREERWVFFFHNVSELLLPNYR